ncbi:general secretion pathway protein GspB [uncultured Piscinibacter sp.]|uniref:general secretion pathway protein GspB n=1 Tax=uncultured Piscinibacter sp. TaxID=1131835 RepID=UPI0026366784|nr:general secretion pathway protein GspB [uncultured Piscinibacter sp.]
MSYILDALRRADAERERGGVPGLHTQAMPELGDDDGRSRPRGLKPWHWLAIGLLGGLAVAVAWQWPAAEPTPPPVSPPPPSSPPVAMPAPAPVTAAPAPATAPVAIAPMRASPPPVAPKDPVEAQGTVRPSPAASAAAPTPQRVGSLAELPADVRAGLPALAFGGSIYSATPANRLLIVNGQLLHEGDALGPGATLEQIKPKAAVLNIRGQRFEVAF